MTINIYRRIWGLVRRDFLRLVSMCMLIIPFISSAFSSEVYSESSRLASGKWVKVKIEKTGMHMISASTLRSWGFNDISKVSIHGYGGRRIADLLSETTYIDDLPATPSVATDAGVIFYGVSAQSWEPSVDSFYHGYLNPYSDFGFYFVTESDSVANTMTSTGTPGGSSPVNDAIGRYHYELERVQATPAGPLFVGEDFRASSSRSFEIPTPGRVNASEVWMECSFVHLHKGANALLTFNVDGTTLPEVSNDRVPATTESSYVHASIGTTRHKFTPSNSEKFTLGIVYHPTAPSGKANLDYLSFNYTRALKLPAEGHMEFWSDNPTLKFEDADNLRIWDVTDPASILSVSTLAQGGYQVWTASSPGMRSYVAWRHGGSFPSPSFVSYVDNQNLHGTIDACDMLIIAPSALLSAANRVANLHRKVDGMNVTVVDQETVYNEFSSGTYDIGGLRKFLKFVYDKSASTDSPLKYVLLWGRATLDHRCIQQKRSTDYGRPLPWWVVKEPRLSMSDNDGYGTDDFVAMLEDGSGTSMGRDYLSVAVGRIPALTAAEGEDIVDKLYQYVEKSKKTGWKNRIIVLADDEDNGVHLRQAENMVGNFEKTELQQHVVDKIYIDAYEKVGSEYPAARREMYRLLDDGVAWWIFTGHANNHSWTGEGMLTYNDINTMYLRNLPFVLASTCNFLRWEDDDISGGEIMYKERYGGTISMISATRPVYITDNGYFLNAFGRQGLSREADGSLVRAGEAYRRTKNDIRNDGGTLISNSNRLRFVFMGDPAMALVTPSNIVRVTAINGMTPDEENQVTIAALSNATIEGRIEAPDGTLLTDFNGVVTIDIYDADYSVTTLAHGEGTEDIFDRHGDKLYSGSTTVVNGAFSLKAAMPSQIADNFRQATMSMYAYATNSNEEATGTLREFYVYGIDEPTSPDTSAPEITSLVLNHAGFQSGDVVNSSPMVIARVEDNVGINLSLAGIGQQMHLTVDDFTSYDDVASFYTPSPDGSPSGTINYPLENLTEGNHTLRLRVFDTSGNTTFRDIDFFVSNKTTPSIFEVFSDANPARTDASFYVRHDRPDTFMEISVSVYNLLGQPVWSGTSRGISDGDVSSPVVWNLCDGSGRRVQRGIYLYRATITTDNERYETASQRIAVAAP